MFDNNSDSCLVQLWVASVIFFMLSHLNMQASAVTPGISEAIKFQSSWVYIDADLLYPFRGLRSFWDHCIWTQSKWVSLGLLLPNYVWCALFLSSFIKKVLTFRLLSPSSWWPPTVWYSFQSPYLSFSALHNTLRCLGGWEYSWVFQYPKEKP